mmetsp:Transcript_44218/g.73388  ORF Transcript_44218/g.73388 Transcript_44218/m.73388 type:complete len:300 (+) Transcript_44218:89-988(+)
MINDIRLHLIATDMDGTFLAPPASEEVTAHLSDYSISTARGLAAAGIVFSIATGRPAPALQPHVDALGLELPCICFNGAAILRMAPGVPSTLLWQSALPSHVLPAIIEFAETEQLCISYALFDRSVAFCSGALHPELLQQYMRLEGIEQQVLESKAELLALSPPLKIVLLTRSPDDVAIRARAHLGDFVDVVSAEMHIEFLRPGVNKGSALAWLCENEGVPLDSALTFGDGLNDIEMLRVSGLGVAMSNAKPAVKDAANITSAYGNEMDGVARECERLRHEGCLLPRANGLAAFTSPQA